MDGVGSEEGCEREEVMCERSHERGVRGAHLGHGRVLFGSERCLGVSLALRVVVGW